MEMLSYVSFVLLCSGIKGWTVRNPDGSSYKAGQAGSAAKLTLQLLLPSASESKREVALQSALSQETFEAAENGTFVFLLFSVPDSSSSF